MQICHFFHLRPDKKYEVIMKSYDELFFTDDFLFSRIMRDPEIAKGVVESLLGIKVKHIEFLTSQYSIEEIYNGRGVRLDAYLEDSDKIYDIEMQTVLRRDEGLRMRYYQSIIDVEHLDKGETYKNLKESYIIFICLDDPFGAGKAVYDFVTKEENGEIRLNDRTHKVIYNAESFEKAADKNVKAFLSYVKNHTSSDKLTDKIQTAVDVSKNHQPWRAEYMLWKDQVAEWKEDARDEGWNEGWNEGRAEGLAVGKAEGRAEGKAEGKAEGLAKGKAEGLAKGKAEGLEKGRQEGILEAKLEAAEKLLKMNLSLEVIRNATGLSEEQLEPVISKSLEKD